MLRIAVISIFFTTIFFLPWYASVLIGMILIVRWNAYLSVIIGGILLDSIFASPIIALGGFEWLYTALFSGLSLAAFLLRRIVME